MEKKYCGLVVWYNPNNDVVCNIDTYIENILVLYIIDNSSSNNYNKLNGYHYAYKCKYIWLKDNKGLAFALEYGCKLAIRDGYDFVLTMDQDSLFEKGAAGKLIYYADTVDEDKYAIVCPNVKSLYYDPVSEKEKVAYINWPSEKNKELKWAMTSGSLMSLKDYRLIEGYNRKLFIQHVDVDLGIQFYLINRSVIAIGDSFLRQHFGNSRPEKFLWKTVYPTYDNPVRVYYRFRNQIYLERKYGRRITKRVCKSSLMRYLVKNMVFEDNKYRRLKLIIDGIYDGLNGRMGKYKG